MGLETRELSIGLRLMGQFGVGWTGWCADIQYVGYKPSKHALYSLQDAYKMVGLSESCFYFVGVCICILGGSPNCESCYLF